MADEWTADDAITQTLSTEEFQMAWALANAAVSGAMPTENPRAYKVSIEDRGDVTTYAFTDTVENRAMLAVRNHFGRGNIRFAAYMLRHWALVALLAKPDPRMERWMRRDGSGALIFEGVLEAAATQPLHRRTLKFNATMFFAAVEAIHASGKYADTGEVW